PEARAQSGLKPRELRTVLTVPDDADGTRLDRFLVSVLPERSRSQIQRLINEGHVRVGGSAAKPNHSVKTGQAITIEVPELVEAEEDVVGAGTRAPEPRSRDAYRQDGAVRTDADAGRGCDLHRTHASDPGSPERDRPSDRRRCAVRRRAPSGARRLAGRDAPR